MKCVKIANCDVSVKKNILYAADLIVSLFWHQLGTISLPFWRKLAIRSIYAEPTLGEAGCSEGGMCVIFVDLCQILAKLQYLVLIA